MLNVCAAEVSTPPFAVPPLSCAATETCTVVVGALTAGVKFNVPLEVTAGCAVKAALLSLLTRNETVCADSFDGPALILVAQLTNDCAPASLETLTSGPLVKLGASLTGVMVMVNVCAAEVSTPPFAVPPSSCATTATVAVPKASGAAVNVRLPDASTDGCALKSALLLLLVVKVTLCDASSAGPAEIAVAHACE